MLINFIIIQFAPGGPMEQAIARLSGFGNMSTTASVSAAGSMGPGTDSSYNGAAGLDPEMIERLEKQFGFDKPAHIRYLTMMGNYLTLDFGFSYFQDRPVVELVLERLPVSFSLGLWSLLLIKLSSLTRLRRRNVSTHSRNSSVKRSSLPSVMSGRLVPR